MNIASLIIGIIAFIFFGISLLQKDVKNILIWQIIANVFYAIQYFLIGGYSAVAMNFLNIARSIVFFIFINKNKKISIEAFIIFIIMTIFLGIFTFDGYRSLLPTFICLLYTYATYQNNLFVTRIIYLATAFIWIYYNTVIRAYTGLLGNSFEIVSNSLALFIYRKKLK